MPQTHVFVLVQIDPLILSVHGQRVVSQRPGYHVEIDPRRQVFRDAEIITQLKLKSQGASGLFRRINHHADILISQVTEAVVDEKGVASGPAEPAIG